MEIFIWAFVALCALVTLIGIYLLWKKVWAAHKLFKLLTSFQPAKASDVEAGLRVMRHDQRTDQKPFESGLYQAFKDQGGHSRDE